MDKIQDYRAKQVAEILGVSTNTVYQFIKDGRIRAYRIGKGWRVKKSELESYIDSAMGTLSSAENIESK